MAITLLMQKRLGSLHPYDDAGTEALSKINPDEIVKITYSRPRNLRFHCKFFAMLGIILANQEHYKTTDELLNVCKLRTGHVTVVQTPQGKERWPASISFANMDETEFSAFYDRAVDWMLIEVIPGLARQHLDAEVEAELLGFAA